MQREYSFTIYGRLPGMNEYTAANRRNRYAGSGMKKDAQDVVAAAIRREIPRLKIKGPVRVHFNWIEPNRRRDLDNIASAKKFILDALVECGVIEDDDQDHVKGFSDAFGVDNKYPRIEVFLIPHNGGQKRHGKRTQNAK